MCRVANACLRDVNRIFHPGSCHLVGLTLAGTTFEPERDLTTRYSHGSTHGFAGNFPSVNVRPMPLSLWAGVSSGSSGLHSACSLRPEHMHAELCHPCCDVGRSNLSSWLFGQLTGKPYRFFLCPAYSSSRHRY